MIDLDLKDFEDSREKIDRILLRALNKLSGVFHGSHPTVLWTGNGYHIYQPVRSFWKRMIDFHVLLIRTKRTYQVDSCSLLKIILQIKKATRNINHQSSRVLFEYQAQSTQNVTRK
jgi:hypothetical protein